MTRTVRSIKLGNHLTGFITLQTMSMQKNQEPLSFIVRMRVLWGTQETTGSGTRMGNKMGFQYLAFQQKNFISKPIVFQ